MDSCCVALNETGSYKLIGEFNKFTIPAHDKIIQALFKKELLIILDLREISSCDSALVALLISYKKNHPDIQLDNIPDQLLKLLSLYNVEDWF